MTDKIDYEARTREVELRLVQIRTWGGDLSAVFRAVGRKIKTLVDLGFAMGKSPTGAAWVPLRFRTGRPLQNSGRLMASIQPHADGEGVTIGTNLQNKGVPYPAVLNFGATIKPKNGRFLVFHDSLGGIHFARKVVIPARQFLPIDKAGNLQLPPAWAKAVLNEFYKAVQP